MNSAALVYPRLSPQQLGARWRELSDQPGLPERWEMDEYGELIEMNPPKRPHQRIVAALMWQIKTQRGGEPLPGLGVITTIGVRIPDVVWQPEWTDRDGDPLEKAPTLCIEVWSPDNSRGEIDGKTRAYLAAGAQEVVVVEMSGKIRFFGAEGERAASALGLQLSLPEGTYPASGSPGAP